MKRVIRIKKGLDYLLNGEAELKTSPLLSDYYAVSPDDFNLLVSTLKVQEGDNVKIGTTLFTSNKNPNLQFVSPISGTVHEIRRGAKRHIEAIIIKKNEDEATEEIALPDVLNRNSILKTLLQYGMFPFFRQRPFDCIPNPDDVPKAIFISGFDSAPLAPNYSYILKDKNEEFEKGLSIIQHLTEGKIYLSLDISRNNSFFENCPYVETYFFKGPHPAGNIGTQIHHIAPLKKGEIVWHIDPWQIALIGILFLHKKLEFKKIVPLCGSEIISPHYLEMTYGASVENSLKNNIKQENIRIISGNILTGKQIPCSGFVGFYDRQITVIAEGGKREFLGWLLPGLKKWSFSHTFLAFLFPKKHYSPHTSLQGSKRTLMLHDLYERVFPFNILPAELYKACVTRDIDLMENLGIYEITAEDFALCELICPSKIEWQQTIQDALAYLHQETYN